MDTRDSTSLMLIEVPIKFESRRRSTRSNQNLIYSSCRNNRSCRRSDQSRTYRQREMINRHFSARVSSNTHVPPPPLFVEFSRARNSRDRRSPRREIYCSIGRTLELLPPIRLIKQFDALHVAHRVHRLLNINSSTIRVYVAWKSLCFYLSILISEY